MQKGGKIFSAFFIETFCETLRYKVTVKKATDVAVAGGCVHKMFGQTLVSMSNQIERRVFQCLIRVGVYQQS